MNSNVSASKLPTRPAHVYSLTLKLTEIDAVALRCLCKRIGGQPTDSPRGLFDRISKSLDSAGMEPLESEDLIGSIGGITFRDYAVITRNLANRT